MFRIALSGSRKLHDYQEAIRRAGGEPWAVEAGVATPAGVVRSARAVVLSGGGDVQPGLYGAVTHPAFSPAEPGRDEYEIELVRAALNAGLPLLAICRGLQVLNVACGGTLVQDIPSELPGALEHRLAVPPHDAVAPAHAVRIDRASLLGRLTGDSIDDRGECVVNSRHHQAIATVGEGLVTVATAPDGVIEGVEAPSHPFCVGVQWHPENFYRTGEFRELFEGLIEACRASSPRPAG